MAGACIETGISREQVVNCQCLNLRPWQMGQKRENQCCPCTHTIFQAGCWRLRWRRARGAGGGGNCVASNTQPSVVYLSIRLLQTLSHFSNSMLPGKQGSILCIACVFLFVYPRSYWCFCCCKNLKSLIWEYINFKPTAYNYRHVKYTRTFEQRTQQYLKEMPSDRTKKKR